MKYLTGYLATIVGFSSGAAHAASVAPTPFSKYGQIQNVQNYSSNPFWNKDSPYNQNFPRPIYATGPDLNTGDCNRTVETLISTYCASKNYCAGMRIGDIRPHIMVQLSQLPGHNFATSCGGYIDSTFDKYMNNRGNTSAVIPPMPTTQPTTSVTIQNPFKQTKSEYQQAVADRTAELNRLQKMTGTPATITPTAFPKTTADISFTDRMANTAAGYLPYKDLPSYRVPNFEEESSQAYLDRLKQLNRDKYCERVPNDPECVAKNTHKITYVTYGGSPTTGAPTTYATGTGATITWQPTRDNSTFVGWCTDIALTNCGFTQTIAPTETADLTFYAKWQCNDSSYILEQNACRDPNQPNPPVNPNPPVDPDPNDNTYVDENGNTVIVINI